MLTEPGEGHTISQRLARNSVWLPDLLAGELDLGLSTGSLMGLFYLLKLMASMGRDTAVIYAQIKLESFVWLEIFQILLSS